MKTIRSLPLWILAILIVSACMSKPDKKVSTAPDAVQTKADLTDSIQHCADSVLRTLTPEQKAAQCLFPALYASADPYTLKKIKEYSRLGIGGLILLKGDPKSVAIIADSMHRWSAVPPIIALDAEWGLAMRLSDTPQFPANGHISDSASEQLMFDYGAEIARECRLLGINMILGPVLDIADKDSYIGKRSMGLNKERVSQMGIAYARGLESGNVLSVAKHFPGHGSVSSDTHRSKGMIERSLQSLDSIDLQPFREYIAQGLSAIMVGHIAFPAIDPKSLPAAVSSPVITDLLRNDLGFKGLIITDAMNMQGAEGMSAADAIEAGADIILAPKSTADDIRGILTRFYPDSLSHTRPNALDSHVRRILFRKYLINDRNNTILSRDSNLNRNLNTHEAARIATSLM